MAELREHAESIGIQAVQLVEALDQDDGERVLDLVDDIRHDLDRIADEYVARL